MTIKRRPKRRFPGLWSDVRADRGVFLCSEYDSPYVGVIDLVGRSIADRIRCKLDLLAGDLAIDSRKSLLAVVSWEDGLAVYSLEDGRTEFRHKCREVDSVHFLADGRLLLESVERGSFVFDLVSGKRSPIPSDFGSLIAGSDTQIIYSTMDRRYEMAGPDFVPQARGPALEGWCVVQGHYCERSNSIFTIEGDGPIRCLDAVCLDVKWQASPPSDYSNCMQLVRGATDSELLLYVRNGKGNGRIIRLDSKNGEEIDRGVEQYFLGTLGATPPHQLLSTGYYYRIDGTDEVCLGRITVDDSGAGYVFSELADGDDHPLKYPTS